jgi:enoyl-CoA hydratase/carnithine racemase
MTYDDIRYEVDSGIATIWIDRPEVKNAFRELTVDELNDALGRANEDESVYVVILTGTDSAFCAGADVTEMPDWSSGTKEEYGEFLGEVQNVVRQLRTGETPSVAAIQGPAIGAGCDFALACDARVVGPDALLREGFVRVVADADSEFLLGAQVVAPEASELIAELALAVESELSVRDIVETIHTHPTLSESVREATANAMDRAIHTLNR